MGQSKRHMEEQERKRDDALAIAIQAGVIEECEFHPGTYYDGGADIEEAYKLGNFLFSQGDVEGAFDSRREMTDFIKEAVEEYHAVDECQCCAKIRDED